MLYQVNSLDSVYEAVFSTPMFTLARQNVDVLRIFYDHLAPKYLVRSSDMQVSGGAALSDVKAKITLFSGNGVLEVTADKFCATFKNAFEEKDIEIIKECVGLSLSALAEWWPAITYREHVIRGTAFLSLLSDSPTAVDDFLYNLIGNKMAFRGEDFGASKNHSGLKVEFENPEEKWIVSFDVSRSWIFGDKLIVNSSAIYQADGMMKSLESKAAHVRKAFISFLTAIGLEAKG